MREPSNSDMPDTNNPAAVNTYAEPPVPGTLLPIGRFLRDNRFVHQAAVLGIVLLMWQLIYPFGGPALGKCLDPTQCRQYDLSFVNGVVTVAVDIKLVDDSCQPALSRSGRKAASRKRRRGRPIAAARGG